MTYKEKLEKIKQLADTMYNKMQNLTTDTSSIRKAMDDYHQFIIYQYYKEEPVSDELEKVVEEIVDPTVLNAYGVKEIANRLRKTMIEPVSEDLEDDNSFEELLQEIYVKYNKEISIEKLLDIASNFAKWQKEQILDCNTTLQRTFELGKQEMKQQMMAKAVDAVVKVEAGNYPYIPQMELYDYDKDIPLAKKGDRYKVVLIKEAEL